jgi:AAA15 family ATPase/GTPase
MLIEFSVANYRSFKDKVTLSMVSADIVSEDAELDQNNVFQVDDQLKLLKSAAIYGANASGKSNLVKALSFMRWLMINSSKETQSTEEINVEPFILSTQTEAEPSFFEIVFILDSHKYRYGFEANRKMVISEWLFSLTNGEELNLFNRTYHQESHKSDIISSEIFSADGLERRTRQNALFLSVSAQFNVSIAEKILNWLTENIKIISGLRLEGLLEYTTKCLSEDHPYRKDVIQLVKRLDLGIKDLSVQPKTKLDVEDLPKDIPEELKKLLSEVSYRQPISTSHQQFDAQGSYVSMKPFTLVQHESEGTKKIVSIAGPLIDILKNGRTLIFDEFDARLHPLISKAIVELFNSQETNLNNSQLIFVTHDTNLLSKRLFRKDQIWFIEKNKYGVTDLYSLVEYKINNDDFSEEDYIKGRYGAIPFVGDLSQIIGG